MPAVASSPAFSTAAFEAFLAARREPSWSLDRRRAAWNAFQQMEWPSRREEDWARTDLRAFKLDKYALPDPMAQAPAGEPPPGLLRHGVELGGHSVAVNSQPAATSLKPKWRDRGVLFGSLDEVLALRGDLLRPHLFGGLFNPAADKFSALHAACWSGGHVLYVPRNVVVDEPLHALSALGEDGVDFGHVLVVLEENAEATLLTETASWASEGSAGGFHCGGFELVQAPGARLRYVSLQNWGGGVWHFAQQKARVDRGGNLQWTVGAIGGRLAQVSQQVALVGSDSECQVNGVLFAEGRQHVCYNTLQHHRAPHTRSDLLYKGALQDQSRLVWRGSIKVDVGAQKTDGYQRNDNLMLSPRCRADSIPGLEIQADDVRCTHGATSGRVDEELLFYAQCRGLTRREATRLVVSGFFQQVFDRITIESVRDALAHAIALRVREYE